MKKNILSLFLASSMILSNCISVLSVNAETATNIEETAVSDNTLITDPEQIKNLLESFIEQNYKGEAIIREYSTGIIKYAVVFSCPEENDPRFFDKYYSQGVYSEFEKFFKENKIESSIVAVHFLKGGTAADNTLITDPEQIKYLLESFIEQNYKGEAIIREFSTGIIKYRVVFSCPEENDPRFYDKYYSRGVYIEFKKFFEENNIDSSLVEVFCLENAIASNDTLVTDTDTQNIFYGDLNNDCIADLTDLTQLSLYLMKSADFTDLQIEAADIDGSGEVDIADLAYFKQYICKDQSVMSKLRIGIVYNGEVLDNDQIKSDCVSFLDSISFFANIEKINDNSIIVNVEKNDYRNPDYPEKIEIAYTGDKSDFNVGDYVAVIYDEKLSEDDIPKICDENVKISKVVSSFA